MRSSSESILGLPAVSGVGGLAAEANFFLGCGSCLTEDIFASAAFLFLVVGGMMATLFRVWRILDDRSNGGGERLPAAGRLTRDDDSD